MSGRFKTLIYNLTFVEYIYIYINLLYAKNVFLMKIKYRTAPCTADEMLTRTGTVVRKNRRRSSGRGSCRRGSAPTVLQAGCVPPSSPRRNLSNTRTYLTPQPSPSKSVMFSFESERKSCYSPDLVSIRRQVCFRNIFVYLHSIGFFLLSLLEIFEFICQYLFQ